eukprot:994396-Rhodomonas_salina.1
MSGTCISIDPCQARASASPHVRHSRQHRRMSAVHIGQTQVETLPHVKQRNSHRPMSGTRVSVAHIWHRH